MTTHATQRDASHVKAPSVARVARRRDASSSADGDSLLRGVLKGVGMAALIALLALAVAVAVVPRVLGGAALTVLSGSMEPTYAPGDLVISAPQERYREGDVVTFQPDPGDPTLITHRIVAVHFGNETSFTTRGDANGADDDPISSEQIMGTVIYSIPYLGYVSSAAGGNRAAIVSVAGVGLLAYGGYLFFSGSRRRRPDHTGSLGNHEGTTNKGDVA